MKKLVIAIASLALMASFSAVQGATITIEQCWIDGGKLGDDVATGDIYCCLDGQCIKCSDCTPEDVIIFLKQSKPNVSAPLSPLKQPPKRNLKRQTSPKKTN